MQDSRDVLLGLTGRDFTIVAASKAAMRGVTILKATDDKTRKLSDHTIMAYAGEAGDTGKYRPLCLMGCSHHGRAQLTWILSAIRGIHTSKYRLVRYAPRL